jgi:nucleolar MIF4G domain-containing protein 1
MLITTIVQSQKSAKDGKDEKALLNIFVKVDVAPQMIPGLQYFLRKVLKKTDLAANKKEKELVVWACGLVQETLTRVASMKLTAEE